MGAEAAWREHLSTPDPNHTVSTVQDFCAWAPAYTPRRHTTDALQSLKVHSLAPRSSLWASPETAWYQDPPALRWILVYTEAYLPIGEA